MKKWQLKLYAIMETTENWPTGKISRKIWKWDLEWTNTVLGTINNVVGRGQVVTTWLLADYGNFFGRVLGKVPSSRSHHEG